MAIISSRTDLGAVTGLWRQPRNYARFLGLELSLAYKGRLLVVMPNGIGFNWPGHSSADAYRIARQGPDQARGHRSGRPPLRPPCSRWPSDAGVKLALPAAGGRRVVGRRAVREQRRRVSEQRQQR